MNKGYVFTGKDQPFMVDVNDLNHKSTISVKAKCDECGSDMETPIFLHYTRYESGAPDLCKSCAAKLGHKNAWKKRSEHWFNKLEEIMDGNGYTLVTKPEEISQFQNAIIKFICPIHGETELGLYNLCAGHRCKLCANKLRGDHLRLSPDQVEEITNATNGNKLLNKDDYKNSSTRNLQVLCGKCGKNVYITSLSSYLNGQTKCRKCSLAESKGEERISHYLDNNSVKYEREKKFLDCTDIHCLPFDFYLPDYNIIIEFDGKHHYEAIHGQDAFENVCRHDSIKDRYCADNGIEIIRIPYWDYCNIENILNKRLIT